MLAALYPWFIFAHVLSAFVFASTHGVSVVMAFRIRAERDPSRIAALLDLSLASTSFMYASLLVLSAFGVLAGIAGNWFGKGWVWASIVLLIAISAAMGGYASPYYHRLRAALALPSPRTRGQVSAPASTAELEQLLRAGKPWLVAAIGGGGLAVVLWLMAFTPF